ncbi:MAG: anthranilate phosphoribosyltransferase [Synechococcaceae cyanobacterium]|nr:anthranilate phosphoribosyltransferase [Synechococcaceae cyanobacterium]
MTSASPSPWPVLLEDLLQGKPLPEEEAARLMRGWLQGTIEPVLTGALLTALRATSPSGAALAAMARELRNAAALPAARPPLDLVDTCGTGGDGAGTFNISTAVAFSAAACGATVAKHGSRSASGRVGSADVLEALGVNLQAPGERVLAALDSAGLTFLFAPGWHPALAGVAPLRRSLGIRTVFNQLGPLANPLAPQAQVLGVARPELLEPMAQALAHLGLRRAVVIHGAGGLDEASLAGASSLRIVEAGMVRAESLDPAALGLEPAPLSALAGGDTAANAAILAAVLQGGGSRPQREVVALNTALVLWAAGLVEGPAEALPEVLRRLAAGEPWQRLERLRVALAPGPDPAG